MHSRSVGYSFLDPSFTLCYVCEVGWLPIVQVFVAALRCQSCFCIKTIQSEAKASDITSPIFSSSTQRLSTKLHMEHHMNPLSLLILYKRHSNSHIRLLFRNFHFTCFLTQLFLIHGFAQQILIWWNITMTSRMSS